MNIIQHQKNNKIIMLFLLFNTIASGHSVASDNPNVASQETQLGFKATVLQAQKFDPWLKGSVHIQRSLESLSTAANNLPDPKVSLGLGNIAADSLDFNQEAMTQFKVGISQVFPRGESLSIKSHQLKTQSLQYPYQRQDRKAKVAVTVGSIWLELFLVQQSTILIEKNQGLFEQLINVTEARYSSAIGKSRQQDIVRAELELIRIEDKLLSLQQKEQQLFGQLSQWLFQEEQPGSLRTLINVSTVSLGNKLPIIDVNVPDRIFNDKWLTHDQLANNFYSHPAVIALDKKIKATRIGTNLAKQKYQPQWGVNASYGYRGDDPMGSDRADLFSVGVTFDLPLFTENKQDQQVKATISQTEAVKTEKQLLIRKLLGAFSSTKGRLEQLLKRKTLYSTKLLPQFHQQAEVALNSYTNDIGDFSEVVRARIAQLNAEIDQLTILVEQQKLNLEINYLFVKATQYQESTFAHALLSNALKGKE